MQVAILFGLLKSRPHQCPGRFLDMIGHFQLQHHFYLQALNYLQDPHDCGDDADLGTSSPNRSSKPELGGYWFFVILTGVDIMDEYKIMEIRVYI